jgi:hypothetical protein
MPRVPPLVLAFLAAAAAAPAAAQLAAPPASEAIPTQPPAPLPPPVAPPPVATSSVIPQPVEVSALAAPDAFTTPARPTGLPATLWKGTSLQVVQAVLPKLADKPLTGAAAALARRVLGTGAPGPVGAAQAPGLAAERAEALIAQGDPKGAAVILARAPGVDRDPELAQVAAESALLAGQEGRACRIEEALGAGRGDIYWLRLRTFCQAISGKTAEAQLSFDLAQSQARDSVFGRLMGAKLAATGDPGAPSLRNGLDYALSRSLGLDLSQAKASPAVAAALAATDPGEAELDLADLAPDLAAIAHAIAAPGPFQTVELERLLDAAEVSDPKARGHAPAAALIAAAFAEPLGPTLRGRLAALPVPAGKAPAGRTLALEAASAEKRMGETALLALWTCAEEPSLTVADRARIVRALRRTGLDADARAFALEGLIGLK